MAMAIPRIFCALEYLDHFIAITSLEYINKMIQAILITIEHFQDFITIR